MNISFHSEAGESFQRILGELNYGLGLTVKITPVEGESFDALFLGADADYGWYDAVRVKRVNEECEPYGDAFTVRVEEIHVY